MKYPRIHKAKAANDTTLIVEFTNQKIKKYDIRHLLDIPMFSPLRQPALFKNFKVEQEGYGIVWNEEIDISEYELWKNGVMVESEDLAGVRWLEEPGNPVSDYGYP
ncbi:MAG: DUF2442 domain-containing protein, partial [Coleofasciculus sp. C2-GNP5-27]